MRRGRHSQGYLVIAMRLTGGPASLDYTSLDTQLRGEEDRRALATLANRDLLIDVEDGWLKALWRPQGFVMFPGTFSSDRWRPVLDAMRRVSQSLDEASVVNRGTVADS